jgi:alpha-tubulin suppressor-like RCC1 family protein
MSFLEQCLSLGAVGAALCAACNGAQAADVATASGNTFLAVHADGSVWAWGGNTSGQQGNGATSSISAQTRYPARIAGLSGVASVSAGGGNNNTGVSLALRRDGTVWAWGYDYYGNLGDGRTGANALTTPVQVAGLSGITQIATAPGMGSSFAVGAGGVVWGWGSNDSGQLGGGSKTTRPRPIQVPVMNNVARIAAGDQFTLAVKLDGTVWGWGANGNGQLADGSATDRLMPVQAAGVNGAVDVCAGSTWAAALLADGTVIAWGQNFGSGPLGLAANKKAVPGGSGVLPVAIPSLTGMRSLACTTLDIAGIDSQGNVRVAGSNPSGTFGNGRYSYSSTAATGLAKVAGAVSLRAAGNSVIATTADGSVWTWGGSESLGEPVRAQSRQNHYFSRTDGAYESAERTPFDVDVQTLTSSGPGVNVSSMIQPADVGRIGSVYVAAMLGTATYFYNGTNWVPWSLATPGYPVYFAGQLPTTKNLKLPEWDASLRGATVYVGYGADAADMMQRQNYRVVYTYQ